MVRPPWRVLLLLSALLPACGCNSWRRTLSLLGEKPDTSPGGRILLRALNAQAPGASRGEGLAAWQRVRSLAATTLQQSFAEGGPGRTVRSTERYLPRQGDVLISMSGEGPPGAGSPPPARIAEPARRIGLYRGEPWMIENGIPLSDPATLQAAQTRCQESLFRMSMPFVLLEKGTPHTEYLGEEVVQGRNYEKVRVVRPAGSTGPASVLGYFLYETGELERYVMEYPGGRKILCVQSEFRRSGPLRVPRRLEYWSLSGEGEPVAKLSEVTLAELAVNLPLSERQFARPAWPGYSGR